MIRSQTVFVVLLILLVLQWDAQRTAPGGTDAPGKLVLAARTDPVDLAIVPALGATEGATESPTQSPTEVATEASAPTQLPETPEPEPVVHGPVATMRPDPPETGQETSLIVERGTSGRLEVAFTFDAGAGAGYTSEILDLLAGHDAFATFGVTGEWVAANPDLTRRIVDEGHMLLNHSWDHASFTGESPQTDPLSKEARTRQIEDTDAIVTEITGGYDTMPYFRFPYGDYDRESLDLLGELGYSYTIWWSCDSLGWMELSPAEIVARCGPGADRGGPGAILLMHVAEENDWDALEPLMRAYLELGYELVTIEQLIQP